MQSAPLGYIGWRMIAYGPVEGHGLAGPDLDCRARERILTIDDEDEQEADRHEGRHGFLPARPSTRRSLANQAVLEQTLTEVIRTKKGALQANATQSRDFAGQARPRRAPARRATRERRSRAGLFDYGAEGKGHASRAPA